MDRLFRRDSSLTCLEKVTCLISSFDITFLPVYIAHENCKRFQLLDYVQTRSYLQVPILNTLDDDMRYLIASKPDSHKNVILILMVYSE